MQNLASRFVPLAAVILGITGCGELDHGDYLTERAEAECNNYRSCAQGFYDSEFRDFDDCVDDRADWLEERDDELPRECDYDGDEARRCVSRIRSMGCEEFADEGSANACDLVWRCE